MTKIEYLKALKHALRRVKPEERKKSLAYFSECIDDRLEEGISEQGAVAELESVEAAAERILAEAEITGQLRPRHSAWELALIVLGFPLWFPLLLLLAILAATLYGLVWLILGLLFLGSGVLLLGGVAGLFAFFAYLWSGAVNAFAVLAMGLAGAGIGLALLVPLLSVTRTYIKATPLLWNRLTERKAGCPQ